jgi:dTDP-glucose 4,6-dehydratase
MSIRHVLITGGAGFIGSHLTDWFLAKGYAVTVVDNYLTGRKENVAHHLNNPLFSLVEQDVCAPMPPQNFRFIAQYGLHGVLHFACPASPIDFEKIPFEILAVDSIGTAHTVELALRFNARYLVASTSEIYGDPLEHPQKESYWGNVNTIGPRACYDETKRFAEAYVSSAQRWKQLNAGIVRIFNTYGPRMRPDDGRVVPELCMQALRGQGFTIHGNGMQTRSFCYVSDLVDGVTRLFESNERDPVNIGNPRERTILEFAEVLNQISKQSQETVFLPARQDDPRRRCPDISRAQKLLNWSPRVDLEEGLSKTLEFFQSTLR